MPSAGTATTVTISYLTIQNFGTDGGNQNQGVVNHNSARRLDDRPLDRDGTTPGAGVMLGSHNMLSYDCLEDNQQYGFNAYSTTGPADLVIDHNEIAGNDTYNWEVTRPRLRLHRRRQVLGRRTAPSSPTTGCTATTASGLWADTNNRGFDIEGNYIAGNYDSGLIYEISYNALISDNTFVRNGIGGRPDEPGLPDQCHLHIGIRLRHAGARELQQQAC